MVGDGSGHGVVIADHGGSGLLLLLVAWQGYHRTAVVKVEIVAVLVGWR